MYGSLTFLPHSNYCWYLLQYCLQIAMKIAQIAQINQLFQLLHSVYIYGHCFNEEKCKQWRQQRFAYYCATISFSEAAILLYSDGDHLCLEESEKRTSPIGRKKSCISHANFFANQKTVSTWIWFWQVICVHTNLIELETVKKNVYLDKFRNDATMTFYSKISFFLILESHSNAFFKEKLYISATEPFKFAHSEHERMCVVVTNASVNSSYA